MVTSVSAPSTDVTASSIAAIAQMRETVVSVEMLLV